MSALAVQSFGFSEKQVRVLDREGQAWFVANDVCKVLELTNTSKAVGALEDDERDGVTISDPIGRVQNTTIISESGLYALIFKSRKPVAVKFRKWVTAEVLPALRRTGSFSVAPSEPEPVGPMALLTSPDEIEKQRLAQNMVRLALQVHGARAAKRAWALLGLPDLSEPEVEPTLLPPPVTNEIHRSVVEWMNERCEYDGKTREGSQDLYRDYLSWCPVNGYAPLSLTGFGRYLTACGIPSIKSDRMLRIGLRLNRDI